MLAVLPLIVLSVLTRSAFSFSRVPSSSLTLSKGDHQLVKPKLPTSSYRKLSNIYQLARTNHAAIVANETLLFLGGEPSTTLPTNSNALFTTFMAWNQPSANTRGGQWWIPATSSGQGTPSVPSLPPQPYATKALLTDYGVMVYAPAPTHATTTTTRRINPPLSSLALLDLKSWTWSYPDTRGKWPAKCAGPSLASRKDTMYMLGGLPLTGDNKPDTTRPLLNEFTSLNMKTMKWTSLPPARPLVQHTMCYNPIMDALITFGGKTEVEETGRGGQGGGNKSGAKEWPVVDWLMLFDLKTNTWNMNVTNLVSGGGPGRRKRHTATCLPNGQMIVYGGSSTMNNAKITDAHDTTYHRDTNVWVLNVTRIKESNDVGSNKKRNNACNWRFVWWKPVITNVVDGPGPRMGHSSSLSGSSMVLYGGTSAGNSKTDISSIHTLDTRLWRWSKLVQPVSSDQVVATAARSKAPTDPQESGTLQASEAGTPEFPAGAVPTEGIETSTTGSAPQPWVYVASVGGGLIFSFTAGMCFWTRFSQRKKILQSEDDEPNADREKHDDSENTKFMAVGKDGERGDYGFDSPRKNNLDVTVGSDRITYQRTEVEMQREVSTRALSVHSQVNTDRGLADVRVSIDEPVSNSQRTEKWSSRVLKKLRSSLSLDSGDVPPAHSTCQQPNVKQLVRTFDKLANKSRELEQHTSMTIESPNIDETPMCRDASNFPEMEFNNERYQSSMPTLGGLVAILHSEAPRPYHADERDIRHVRRTSLASLSSFEYLAKGGYLSPTVETSPSPFDDTPSSVDDSEDGIDIESFSTVGRLSKLPAAVYIAQLMADIAKDAENRSAKFNAEQEQKMDRLSGNAQNEENSFCERQNVDEIRKKRESSGEQGEGANHRLVKSERALKDETINSSCSYHTSHEVWVNDENLSQERVREIVPIDGKPTGAAYTNQVATPIVPLNASALSRSKLPGSPTCCDQSNNRPEIPAIMISSKVEGSRTNLPRLESTRTISTLATLVDGVEGYYNQPEKTTLCAEEEVGSGRNKCDGPMVHWDESLMKIQINSDPADFAKPKSLNAVATKSAMVSATEVPQPVKAAVRRWSFLRALRYSRGFSSQQGGQTTKHNVDYSPYSSSVPPASPTILLPIATVSAGALMTPMNQIPEDGPGRIAFVSRSLAADLLSESHSPLDRLAKMRWASRAQSIQRHRQRRTEVENEGRLSGRPGQAVYLTPEGHKIRPSCDVSTLGARGARVESQDMSYCEWSIGEAEVSSIFSKTNILRREIGEVGLSVTAV